jgi:hypothetical protein
MSVSKLLDITSCILIDPSNHEFSSVEKGLAWTTTVIAAILSLGTAHILSALWRRLRHVEENDTHRAISNLFNEIFGRNEKSQKNELNTSPADSSLSLEGPSISTQAPENISLVKTSNPESVEDISPAIQACEETIEKIKEIIACSQTFDAHIKGVLGENITLIDTNTKENKPNPIEERLEVTFFKFDPTKWERVLKDIEKAVQEQKMVSNAEDLIKECHLDLVEALAEYNVERWLILNDYDKYEYDLSNYLNEVVIIPRENDEQVITWKTQMTPHINEFKKQNRFLNTIVLENPSTKIVEIFNQAKQTGKASLQINYLAAFEERLDSMKFAPEPTHSAIGPYFLIIVEGTECEQGNLPEYRNTDQWGALINFDCLIGKKQGDRLVVQTKEGEQFIIRLNQKIGAIPLEEKIILGICSYEFSLATEASSKQGNEKTIVTHKDLDRRKSIFQQLEDAYGIELLNKVKKAKQIFDPRIRRSKTPSKNLPF